MKKSTQYGKGLSGFFFGLILATGIIAGILFFLNQGNQNVFKELTQPKQSEEPEILKPQDKAEKRPATDTSSTQADEEKAKAEKEAAEKEAKAKEVKVPPKEDKKQQEELPQKQETKTIKDLKKLQYIGNMKISVGRGKKSNITEVSEEVVEKKELPKVPEGFLDNIISTTKSAYKKYDNVKKSLSEEGYLDEN